MSVETSELYDGRVSIEFNEGNHRYKVTDKLAGFSDYRPGVSGVLATLDKAALKDWAAWMASEYFKAAVARHKAEGGAFNDLWLTTTADQAKNAHNNHSQRAKDIGHVVHSMIEQYLKAEIDGSGQADKVTTIDGVDMKAALNLLVAFRDWYDSSGLTVVGSEKVVYSVEHEYCGTFDCMFEDKDGRIILGDVKTTKRTLDAQKGVYAEYVAQLGAYAQAWEEETGRKVHDLIVLNPDKTYGEMVAVRLSELGISVAEAKTAFLELKEVYDLLIPLKWKLKKQNELKRPQWFAYARENKK